MPEDEFENEYYNEKTQKFIKEIKMTLTLLPCWAKVAFAARCARRVLPLYNMMWSDSMQEEELLEHIHNLKKIVSIAEVSAAKTVYASDIPQSQWQFYINPLIVEALPAFYAIETAYIADGNVSNYCNSLDEAVLWEIRVCDKNAIHYKHSTDKIRKAILDDYKFLIKEAKLHNWTDETPVHKEIFGKMWPSGEPDDWL